MNYYPEALTAIVAYIEALNAVEKAVGDADHIPFLGQIPLTDATETDYGKLADEIGGSWSWQPPVRHG